MLNSLTGEALEDSFDVLKPGGRFVEIGKLGILTAEQAAARRPDVTYFSFDVDEEITKDQTLVHRSWERSATGSTQDDCSRFRKPRVRSKTRSRPIGSCNRPGTSAKSY